MAKKLSRKDLKEPDEFIGFTTRAMGWISEQKIVLIIGASALALVILGSYGFRWYNNSKEEKASIDFIEAKKILDARVAGEGIEPGSDQQEGSYASNDAKYKAALEAFEKVRKNHPSARTANLATYFIGDIQSHLGEYEKASESFKDYLKEEGETGELSAFALEGIAASLEAQGKDADAIEQYRRLTKPPFDIQPDRGLYHVARIEQKMGKTSEAIAHYKEILEKYPQTSYRREIQQRLDNLSAPPGNINHVPAGESESAKAVPKPPKPEAEQGTKKEAQPSGQKEKAESDGKTDAKGAK